MTKFVKEVIDELPLPTYLKQYQPKEVGTSSSRRNNKEIKEALSSLTFETQGYRVKLHCPITYQRYIKKEKDELSKSGSAVAGGRVKRREKKKKRESRKYSKKNLYESNIVVQDKVRLSSPTKTQKKKKTLLPVCSIRLNFHVRFFLRIEFW